MQSVFERNEKKYRITAAQRTALLQVLLSRMSPDEYGLSTVCSLYYDTQDFDVIRLCMDRPGFKQKLRLRSYGVPGLQDTVYVELKKKFNGITYKRRVAMPLRTAQDYLNRGILPIEETYKNNQQIFGEIDFFCSQHPLEPKILLCYDRIAYIDPQQPQLRITIDANIRWRDYNLSLSKGDHGAPLLGKGYHLMEIKTAGPLDYDIAHLLSKLRIFPISFSKYGAIYKDFLIHKEGMFYVG